MSGGMGTCCCICFNPITPQTAWCAPNGDKWDVCSEACAHEAGLTDAVCTICAVGEKEMIYAMDDYAETCAICTHCWEEYLNSNRTLTWWQVRASYLFAKKLLAVFRELNETSVSSI